MYFVLFLIFDILELVFWVNAALHPRPHNLVLCAVNAVFCVLTFLWTHRDRYHYADDYKKELAAWKKRKREAKRSKAAFEEAMPVKPRHLVPGFWGLLVVYLFSLYIAYAVSVIPDLAFAKHMPYEYKRDIAKCKESKFYDYSCFPDELPKEAKNVEWIMQPSFLQGSGYELLLFEAPEEYIEGVIREHAADVAPCGVEEDMFFISRIDRGRLSDIQVYKLSDNGDWNHRHMSGFFVDKEQNQIGFFCE